MQHTGIRAKVRSFPRNANGQRSGWIVKLIEDDPEFKLFDRVLVRNNDLSFWNLAEYTFQDQKAEVFKLYSWW